MGEPDSIGGAELRRRRRRAAARRRRGVIAEVVGTYSVSDEFLGTWRTDEQDYLHAAFPAPSRPSSATRRVMAR